MIKTRHCARVLRRDLRDSGRPDLQRKVLIHRRSRDGGWSPFVLQDNIPIEDVLWILDLAHSRWPCWVADVSDEWLEYYQRFPRIEFPDTPVMESS